MNDTELLRTFASQCCGAQFTRTPSVDNYGFPTIVNTCDYCDKECCLVNLQATQYPLAPEEVERLTTVA